MRYSLRSLFFLHVASLLTLCTATAANAQTAQNVDIYIRAIQAADDVELIREYMGRPFDDAPRLPASDVSQVELFFVAQTFFRKANQLAQEVAGAQRLAAAAAPEGDVLPSDTLAVVSAAHEQISNVKASLGIEEQIVSQPRRTPVSPTGVFMAIIDLNRQLNLLIDQPISPADVFEQVTLATFYSSASLTAVTGSNNEPPDPVFDGHRRPSDVYARLLECLDIVSEIAAKAGTNVLSLSSRRNLPDDIEPGHVYDIARILVADLAILADALDAQDIYPDLPTPDRIFPTQVHERAGVLQDQLQSLNNAL